VVFWNVSVISAVILSGCNGKVPTWGELTKQQPPPAEQTTTIQSPTPEQVQPPVMQPVQPPAKPKPEEVVAEFKKLKPGQVSNSSIAMLTSLDEGLELVTEIDATTGSVDDDGVGGLPKLTSLRQLRLEGTKVSDKGCQAIGQVASLEELTLTGGYISDVGMEFLKDLTQLKKLKLAGTQLSLHGWEIIGALPQLQEIWIDHSSINDESMEALCNATTLETLDIHNCQVTDEGLRHLGKLDNLLVLELQECPITCYQLSSLVKNKGKSKLIRLGVYGTNLNDRGVAAIASLTSLEYLNVGKLQGMTDAYFGKLLSGKKNLKVLGCLHNPALTNAALSQVKACKELEFLDFSYNPLINDQGLVHLTKLKKLNHLNYANTGVTPVGIAMLQKHLPELNRPQNTAAIGSTEE